ncbi:hypothetical protein N9Y92_00850 [Chlamydiales bacterium]|nr:hypothetical protein [Chlamydiales bacterium]
MTFRIGQVGAPPPYLAQRQYMPSLEQRVNRLPQVHAAVGGMKRGAEESFSSREVVVIVEEQVPSKPGMVARYAAFLERPGIAPRLQPHMAADGRHAYVGRR